ncbi:TPA: hypothetical protein DCW54_02980 [Candidatus Dependentiae bacterium]|nr:hypothetical protein [Candidatus Dependentiae bacterium]
MFSRIITALSLLGLLPQIAQAVENKPFFSCPTTPSSEEEDSSNTAPCCILFNPAQLGWFEPCRKKQALPINETAIQISVEGIKRYPQNIPSSFEKHSKSGTKRYDFARREYLGKLTTYEISHRSPYRPAGIFQKLTQKITEEIDTQAAILCKESTEKLTSLFLNCKSIPGGAIKIKKAFKMALVMRCKELLKNGNDSIVSNIMEAFEKDAEQETPIYRITQVASTSDKLTSKTWDFEPHYAAKNLNVIIACFAQHYMPMPRFINAFAFNKIGQTAIVATLLNEIFFINFVTKTCTCLGTTNPDYFYQGVYVKSVFFDATEEVAFAISSNGQIRSWSLLSPSSSFAAICCAPGSTCYPNIKRTKLLVVTPNSAGLHYCTTLAITKLTQGEAFLADVCKDGAAIKSNSPLFKQYENIQHNLQETL